MIFLIYSRPTHPKYPPSPQATLGGIGIAAGCYVGRVGEDLRGVPALEAYLLGEIVADHGDILLNERAKKDVFPDDARERQLLHVGKGAWKGGGRESYREYLTKFIFYSLAASLPPHHHRPHCHHHPLQHRLFGAHVHTSTHARKIKDQAGDTLRFHRLAVSAVHLPDRFLSPERCAGVRLRERTRD